MKNKYLIILFILVSLLTNAQHYNFNPYLPSNIKPSEWKYAGGIYYNSHLNSSHLTNEFLNHFNQSKYINDDIKDKQLKGLNEPILNTQSQVMGADFWLNSKSDEKFSYYFGFDHQNIIDSQLDPNLIGLLLYGNKKYAGENLQIKQSNFYSTYFNRIKIGGIIDFGNSETKHTIAGFVSVILGQNHEEINIGHAQIFTQQDGDYIDLGIQAQIELADTNWADIWTVNGLGSALDVHYSLVKEKNYYIGLSIKNLGFINWHRASFSGTVDTNFRYEGLNQDQENTNPDNFSYDNLRQIIFKNAKNEAFTKLLPMDIHLTAGKYFSQGKFYAGISTSFYPTLHYSYQTELFFTWNHRDKFHITPIIAYNSFEQLTAGLSFGANISKTIIIRAGSSYLSSFFSPDKAASQGGFISIVFVR